MHSFKSRIINSLNIISVDMEQILGDLSAISDIMLNTAEKARIT